MSLVDNVKTGSHLSREFQLNPDLSGDISESQGISWVFKMSDVFFWPSKSRFFQLLRTSHRGQPVKAGRGAPEQIEVTKQCAMSTALSGWTEFDQVLSGSFFQISTLKVIEVETKSNDHR